MLQRYAFSFYEVVCRLESLREKGRLQQSASYPIALMETYREDLLKSLREMRMECDALGLSQTSDLTSHIESGVLEKNKHYTYNDLLKDLDTLSFSFSNELKKRLVFRVEDEKLKYFQNLRVS